MDLKHILPIEVNFALKHFTERFKYRKPNYCTTALDSEKRVFFLDAPEYGNIGDQAIALGMETFIADVLPDYKQVEVTEDKLPATMRWLKDTICDNDIICLTGGGNMGVMYQKYEAIRRLVINNFPQNPIIIFPQTFDYGSDKYAVRELRRAEKLYGAVKRLIICARDEESFQQMRTHFPAATVIFCPDIVLYLDYRECFEKTDKVGICLRNDKERVLTDKQRIKINKLYPNAESLSTIDEAELPISWRNRKKVVEKKLKEFGSKKLILTDRLHGMIFAFITNTPCIAFPNTNGKVKRVSRYLSENGNVIFSETVDNVTTMFKEKNSTVRDKFGELIDAVKSIAIS